MDFHDFPRVLGKSGCRSTHTPKDVCRPRQECFSHSVSRGSDPRISSPPARPPGAGRRGAPLGRAVPRAQPRRARARAPGPGLRRALGRRQGGTRARHGERRRGGPRRATLRRAISRGRHPLVNVHLSPLILSYLLARRPRAYICLPSRC